jgi:hypothetical protein
MRDHVNLRFEVPEDRYDAGPRDSGDRRGALVDVACSHTIARPVPGAMGGRWTARAARHAGGELTIW